MRKASVLLLAAAVTIGFGAVGTSVRAACNSAALGKASYGGSGATISALQNCLIDAGYTIPAGPTGYYGAQTKAAVMKFYAAHMNLPTWDGLSVGPLGRAKLATVSDGSTNTTTPTSSGTVNGYKKVGSASELATYVAEQSKQGQYGMGVMMRGGVVPPMAADTAEQSVVTPSSAPTAGRVSETNVQVAGIDEPDIVKTDGTSLFISRQGYYYGGGGGGIIPMMAAREGVAVDAAMPRFYEDKTTTKVVDAFPVSDLSLASEIKEKGEMLLVKEKNILVVLSYPTIVAYDVTDQKKPVKKWDMTLENNSSVVSARLTNGSIYLVTQTWLDQSMPCPVIPLMRGTTKISISCGDIWVPMRIEPVSSAISVVAVDPTNGNAKQTLTFATDGNATTIAMFKDNIYLATKSYTAPYDVLTDITVSVYMSYLSTTGIEKVKKIQGYDISPAGKLNEITQVIQAELASKPENDRLKIETEAQNSINQKLELRKRDLDRTRIVRIPVSTLTVAATGEIPGTLLNQFSLDEYNGDVRVAVTVGNNWWGGSSESANDVYVLGSDLKQKGALTNLGLGERIYSARFIGDKGYLVTFKQIDPFYVLDLSVPSAPKVAGELKIPGYSAYLEPLAGDMILGVGREGNGVKLSLFDVSNPAKPLEKAKYIITDAWTEVEGNHHAFLKDADHQVFFLPGGNGGYVFSYAGGTLSLKATIAGWSVNRAVYIDDNLYVIGDEKITVLDENTWKEVKTLSI